MARRLLKKGDKIRLKVPTLGGWKGYATVMEDQLHKDDGVWFRKDDADQDDFFADKCSACSHEVALRRQTTKRKSS